MKRDETITVNGWRITKRMYPIRHAGTKSGRSTVTKYSVRRNPEEFESFKSYKEAVSFAESR